MMATEQLLLLLVGSLALPALLLGLWLLLVSIRQGKELQHLRQQILPPTIQGDSSGKETVTPPLPATNPSLAGVSFSTRLDEVERYQVPNTPAPRNPVEKYGYVASMAKQGMTAAQIADALRMAPAEVDQLLRLASLKPGS